MGSGFAKRKKMMKQMQEQFSQMQETEITGSAGGGLVEVTLTGDHKMKNIKIKPECVDPDDIEGLEDLILDAHKKALKEIEKSMPSAGGLGGMF